MTMKVMTFIVQCKGKFAAFIEGISYDNDERSRLIANKIMLRAEADRPDIIFLQEVFDGKARENFTEIMKDYYPYVTDELGAPGLGDILEARFANSGLMALSRFPFEALDRLDGSPRQYFQLYGQSAGDDALSSKGVAVVTVLTDYFKHVTFAFTHMQSPYDAEDEHREIRASQLNEMMKALKKVLGRDPSNWHAAVMLGDFNIRGDGLALTDEFLSMFNYNEQLVWA